jgi:hypothetical protein
MALRLFATRAAGALLLAHLPATVLSDSCTSAIWDETLTDGDWTESENWKDGEMPSPLEQAVVAASDGTSGNSLLINDNVAASSLLILDGGQIMVDIDANGGSGVWLVLGEDTVFDGTGAAVVPCTESEDCPQETLNVAAGFTARPIGSGIQYDAGSEEILGTGLYNAFNMTCADGYASVGNATSEVVTCPFAELYDASSFELLACAEIIYESDWCSAGVLALDDQEGDWGNDRSWVYNKPPTKCVVHHARPL